MIKIWGGSSRRAVNKKSLMVGEDVRAYKKKNQKDVIDFDSFFTWFNEQEAKEAAGNELNAARSYSTKQKKLRFLSL